MVAREGGERGVEAVAVLGDVAGHAGDDLGIAVLHGARGALRAP